MKAEARRTRDFMKPETLTENPQRPTDVASGAVLGCGKWTQAEAIDLCVKVEAICPKFGCHVALTGGLLYKQGERKDCDLLFYRIRQVEQIDFDWLWDALNEIGLEMVSGFGWCYKGKYCGRSVDMFSPEEQGGEYNPDEVREAAHAGRADTAEMREPLNQHFGEQPNDGAMPRASNKNKT